MAKAAVTKNTKNALVIVESPTKAKTIRRFLPKNFVVEASMGHVRDLPQSASDIPKALKHEEWTKIGVNVENDFEPLYVISKGKNKIIAELRKKLKNADILYLATDEDREGESISWHLISILKPKIPVKRMVFHEITKEAIQNALEDCREIDTRLVRAQETRRILDRLVGYTLSPLIWKKIAYGLSAGRVQSAGLRLIVERERERMRFQKAEYWDLQADLLKSKQNFQARLMSVKGKKVAQGKDFDEHTGKLKNEKDIIALTKKESQELKTKIQNETWKVISVEERPLTSRPLPPFITSTMQQEANRKLYLSSKDAMRTAQRLYEEGLITYMRTDSPNLSKEGMNASRNLVKELYGSEYLSPEPRQFASKSKSAQEAHEAIRPAGAQFLHPKDTHLSGKELALYDLIWKRTLASQMAEAKKQSLQVKIEAGDTVFSASGNRIIFPGFLRAYVEGSDDPEASLEDKEVLLPQLEVGQTVDVSKIEALFHETKAKARFTEASLVQVLEKEGVGRPSTYASIISTIQDRGYVRKVGNTLVPTFTGMGVIQLLERHFDELVDLGFTSQMEDSLDEIAEGKKEWLPYLKNFYLGKDGLKAQVEAKEKKIDPEESRSIILDHLKDVEVRIGRYGAYVVKKDLSVTPKPKKQVSEKGKKTTKPKEQDQSISASIPMDIAPADLDSEKSNELIAIQEKGPQPLGKHPESGESIYCLVGRFGPYVQLGEITEEKPKPKRASVPKEINPSEITLEQAVLLLRIPRDLGLHPETKKPIVAGVGRFGPYVVHDGDFRSLKKEDDVYTVSLSRALELLAEEKKGRRGAKLVREVGVHPDDQKPIAIYEGKYGLYIKYKSTNATLPKDKKPEDVTLKEALELLAERKGAKKKKKS